MLGTHTAINRCNYGIVAFSVLIFGSQEQQDQFPLQKVLKVAATEREFGNYLFRQNRFYDAKVRYKRVRMLKKCLDPEIFLV